MLVNDDNDDDGTAWNGVLVLGCAPFAFSFLYLNTSTTNQQTAKQQSTIDKKILGYLTIMHDVFAFSNQTWSLFFVLFFFNRCRRLIAI
ncbi:hypothetical protein BDB00DRAFT_225772 [Zychaea mexicana]|uniref:uncharacterized protein n=1 Tax=Zychaea mexicana TaxID=64656 RepID=UPI0022FE29F8|nr:uncharacterized protein BDB00DRAFT_225772 [Zychaea mexicana]KAI9499260.1 hypothetical protein BDB00DRAFT_225772 [Zychaea mexicana]